jgi:four helix bundle protein
VKSRITRFEDLIAWQKARVLTAQVYRITRSRPFAIDFGASNQIRSAALSIGSNIAEGFERNRLAEFHQFLSVAKSSCAEVRSQLYTAFDVGYIDEKTMNELMTQAQEVGRVVGGLRASVEREMQKLASLRTQDSGLRTSPPRCSSKM